MTKFAATPTEVQLCIFSTETEVFADDEALVQALEGHSLNIGPISFIPEGMFRQDSSFSGTTGFGTGRVTDAGTVVQGFSGLSYNWAAVKTVGGSFSVVWAPDDAPAATAGGAMIFRGPIAARAMAPFWQTGSRK